MSLGAAGTADGFAAAIDLLEAARIDSLWLPETVYGPAIDPFTGIAFAVARTSHLKVGTGISVLPGRHPVLVAKQLASLAALAPGRVLPAFGLRPAREGERTLFPVPPGRRADVFDEALTLLRLMLTEPSVSFEGRFFSVQDASVGPVPSRPLDIWLGGSAPAGLRRVGRLADGWLGSLLTPAEAGEAIQTINAAADEAGRTIEQDHFGISLSVALEGIPDAQIAAIGRRRPGIDPSTLVADGWAGARRMISAYVKAGLTKFVVRPATPNRSLEAFVGDFTRELLPLQS
jgi:probable F420-dependent oxidoreductase